MLSRKNFYSLSLLAFGIFFGAGNLIFPPTVAQLAGTNIIAAFGGFFFTAVLLPVLGIIVVSKTDGLLNLGKKVDPIFAYILTIGILIAIGPGLAIPRTGSTSFEMMIKPYLGSNESPLPLLMYTIVYFGLVALVSWSPNKIVNHIGRFTTPALLILIAIMTFLAWSNGQTTLLEPTAAYQQQPFFNGFISGYNTLDTLAGLNYGLLIITAIRNFNVEEKRVTSLATKTGMVAGAILTLVYVCLTLIGQVGASRVDLNSNGADILFASSQALLGTTGSLILGAIFVLACFNTCVGLVISISQYFNKMLPKISYHTFVIILSVWSLALANIGLNGILAYSVPVLLLLYPVAIALIVLALTEKLFNHSQLTYRVAIYVTIVISIISTLTSLKIEVPLISNAIKSLPLTNEGLNWVIPFFIVLIGFSLYQMTNKKAV